MDEEILLHARKLKELRTALGLSRTEFGIKMGYSEGLQTKLENGQRSLGKHRKRLFQLFPINSTWWDAPGASQDEKMFTDPNFVANYIETNKDSVRISSQEHPVTEAYLATITAKDELIQSLKEQNARLWEEVQHLRQYIPLPKLASDLQAVLVDQEAAVIPMFPEQIAEKVG